MRGRKPGTGNNKFNRLGVVRTELRNKQILSDDEEYRKRHKTVHTSGEDALEDDCWLDEGKELKF